VLVGQPIGGEAPLAARVLVTAVARAGLCNHNAVTTATQGQAVRPRKVHLMIKQVLEVSAASSAIMVAMTIAAAPAAFADNYCGQASSGAKVFAGNSDTSCEFAMSTAEAYRNHGVGSQPFSVYSPVTGQTYTMTCIHAGSVCQGGNNALVYFRD
jgi:hypothetical protein